MTPEMDEPIVVYMGSFAMAGLLKSQLEDAGITADLWDAAASTIVPLTLQAKIAVVKSDIERVKPIVEHFIQQQAKEASEQ